MEAAKVAKEKVNETGITGGEQMEFKEGGLVDGGSRESVEH